MNPALREIDKALERMQMQAERRLGFYLGFLVGMFVMAAITLMAAIILAGAS